MQSTPKILVRLSDEKHISNIWHPHAGGEIAQVLFIIAALESGFDVLLCCHGMNYLPKVDDSYKKMKGNLKLISDVNQLHDDSIDLCVYVDGCGTIDHSYIWNKINQSTKKIAYLIWSTEWNDSSLTNDAYPYVSCHEKVSSFIFFDHWDASLNKKWIDGNGKLLIKTKNFSDDNKSDFNSNIKWYNWYPPLKYFVRNSWNPVKKRIIIDSLYKGSPDTINKEYFIKIIYDISKKYDDIFFDIIIRNSIHQNLDRVQSGKDPNPTFNFWEFFSHNDDCLHSVRFINTFKRDLLNKYISESLIYLTPNIPPNPGHYRKGDIEPVLTGIPTIMYKNEIIDDIGFPFYFETGIHDIKRPNIKDLKEIIEKCIQDPISVADMFSPLKNKIDSIFDYSKNISQTKKMLTDIIYQ
tara:strand:+ start:12545 stop:13771 length:1227 start_codon:yes stop_codon:yes gene_type:complete